MSNEESEAVCVKYDFVDENPSDAVGCWAVGSAWASGPDASKLFYNIRQRFDRKRRKVLSSLKGKSGQGVMAQYVPSWPLYEDCMFLVDHIVARKYALFSCSTDIFWQNWISWFDMYFRTSSSYSSALPLPNTKQAAAIKSQLWNSAFSTTFIYVC